MERQKRKMGFAVMSHDERRRIASLGGKAAHEQGTAHEYTSEEAAAAGRKGGRISAHNRAIKARATK